MRLRSDIVINTLYLEYSNWLNRVQMKLKIPQKGRIEINEQSNPKDYRDFENSKLLHRRKDNYASQHAAILCHCYYDIVYVLILFTFNLALYCMVVHLLLFSCLRTTYCSHIVQLEECVIKVCSLF